MTNPFPDTKEYPTPAEMMFLKDLETRGGYANVKSFAKEESLIISLTTKGLIFIFRKHPEVYACLTSSIASRMVTFYFYAYQIKVGVDPKGKHHVLTDAEHDKMALMRKLTANWIFNRDKIKDEHYSVFLRFFTAALPFVLSIPKFMTDELKQNIEETGIEYSILTPEFRAVRCQMCGFTFDSSERDEFFPCPKCQSRVLVR